MKYYVIAATMKNGDKWETRRDTFKGMDSVVKDILKDKEVKNFSVEERV
jgi:allantoicase|tara:strand:+ start:208 stop:354 length:147 start_codon:yes stop_codon:yes gene_type:complete